MHLLLTLERPHSKFVAGHHHPSILIFKENEQEMSRLDLSQFAGQGDQFPDKNKYPRVYEAFRDVCGKRRKPSSGCNLHAHISIRKRSTHN